MHGIEDIVAQIAAAPGFDPSKIDPAQLVDVLDDDLVRKIFAQVEADDLIKRTNRFAAFFPDEGPLRRELYHKHLEFFRAGADYTERLFQAGNRVGKTITGAYEVTCHTTGRYPHWWDGRVFSSATTGWAAGDTNETTRDIIQKELLGEVTWEDNRKTFDGTGMIPKECIGSVTWKQGVPNLADTVKILHVSGRWSTIGLKSYDQGRRVFQGTAKHWIWLDEEPPADVYGEALIRLMTTKGLMLITFTPLRGISEVVDSFMLNDRKPAG